jgi:DNA repair protein RecO (recombination protein O)
MAIQKTNAIILKTQPFRSTSLIVTCFSESFGKVRGLVKGVRQERELRGPAFELFTQVEILFYEKQRSDLHLISDAVILETYDALHSRLEAIAYASYFSELVDVTTEVHDAHEKIYELLDFSYRYVAVLPGERLSTLFEIKLLNEIGWLPHLQTCLNCESPAVEKGFFSARQGALYCETCGPRFPDALPLGAEPLSVLRYYTQHDLEDCLKLGMTRQTETELSRLMQNFLMDRLGKPFKTRIFIEKIKPALR